GMLARVLAYELERETAERDARRLNDSLRSQARGMAAVSRSSRALAADDDARPAIVEAAGRELVPTAMFGVDMPPVTIQARADQPRGAKKAFASLESYFVADATD